MRILLTGAGGMLGSSIAEAVRTRRPDDELIAPSRADLDLRDADRVRELVARARPDAVVHAAARVGGIAAKLEQPTRFLLENLQLDSVVLGAALDAAVPSLLYVGSAAVYPEETAQPIPETALLTGPLEPANEGYALAKIAGQRLCAYAAAERGLAWRTVIPSNLYGPGDRFGIAGAHLIPAALAKVDAAVRAGAASVEVWGDGTARREFTYSGDVAAFLADSLDSLDAWPAALNVGAGVDHSIAEYYEHARTVVGFAGDLEFDPAKPSGVPQRLLDSSSARALGWRPTTSLLDGMAAAYASYLDRRPEGPSS